jgi:hypothetical protein
MKLNFPDLLLSHTVTIYVQKGIDAQGKPIDSELFSGKCHFERKEGTKRTKDGEYVKAASKVYVKGDIATDQDSIKGYLNIEGVSLNYRIESITKFYNPDKTVHHCELEVI